MYLFYVQLAVLLLSYTAADTTAENVNDSVTEPFDKYMRPSAETYDQTVPEIANEQTEIIKQIVASQKPAVEIPILQEKEPVRHLANEKEIKEEQGPYEDFKAKCEYYFKIYNIQQKESGSRKQKPITSHLYASRYGTQPLPLPAVYIENQFNPKPITAEPPKSEAVHEGTWYNKYYEHTPYGMPNKPGNFYISHVPYIPYPSSASTPVPPTQQVSSVQSANQISSGANVNSGTSINRFGIIQEETSQNKYYEYVPSSTESPKPSPVNVPYIYSPGLGNQPSLPFPIYAENQFYPRPTVEPFIAVPKIEAQKESITQGKYIQYVPYGVIAYPTQHITPVQQNGEIQNEQVTLSSNKEQQVAQVQSQYEANLEQKHIIHNSVDKSVNVAPLTLQNALISDGKNLYYWYKSMPGYQVYLNAPYPTNTAPNKLPKFEEPMSASSQIHNYESKTKYTYVTHPPKLPETTTTTIPPSTTTEIVPSYEVKYSIKDKDAVPKEYFKHQLKFVYPIPVATKPVKSNWRVSPHSVYHPQDLQSSLVRMPYYAPTFQVIKTLDIPNRYVDKVVAATTSSTYI